MSKPAVDHPTRRAEVEDLRPDAGHRRPFAAVTYLVGTRETGIAVVALSALLTSSWTGLLVVAALPASYEATVTHVARRTAAPAEGEESA
ncbi:hypothetical protein ACIRP7_31600 [Streptomyces sp. NPDC102270]|uniref:hypothetical protein n=1 Tax=Streptomyces sp. NPDC102270 TaxID=3366150 RepID=UPI00380C137A